MPRLHPASFRLLPLLVILTITGAAQFASAGDILDRIAYGVDGAESSHGGDPGMGRPAIGTNGSAAGVRPKNFRRRWSDIAPAYWVLRDWPPGPISGWRGWKSFVLKPNGRWLSGGVAAEGRTQSSCCMPKSCDRPPSAHPDTESFRAARVTA